MRGNRIQPLVNLLRLHGEKNLRAGWALLGLGGAGAALLYAQITWRGGATWGFCGTMPVALAILGGGLNVAYGLSIDRAVLGESTKAWASWASLVASVAMPAGCLAGAWLPDAHAVLPIFGFVFAAALAVLAKGFFVPCGAACETPFKAEEDDNR